MEAGYSEKTSFSKVGLRSPRGEVDWGGERSRKKSGRSRNTRTVEYPANRQPPGITPGAATKMEFLETVIFNGRFFVLFGDRGGEC